MPRGRRSPRGGKAPASVGVAGDMLVVVDKAHDPRRDARLRAAARTRRSGSAPTVRSTPTGKPFTVDAGSSPTQALAVDDRVVVSTEETGPFRPFVARRGRLARRRRPDSPLPPESSIFEPRYDGRPLGDRPRPRTRRGASLYANQAATEQLLVYRYDARRAADVRPTRSHNSGAKLPVLDGDHARTAGSSTPRTRATARSRRSRSRDARAPTSTCRRSRSSHGANPWGLALDPAGRTLFVVDPRAVDGVPKILGNRLHVLAVGEDGRLSEIDAAPEKLPVEERRGPLGIAVVPA